VQRIVGGARGIGVGLERHSRRPVEPCLVLLRKSASAVQQVSLEVIGFAGDHPRAVEDLVYARAMIVGIAEAFTVNGALSQALDATLGHEHTGWPSQRVISHAAHEAPAVPGADWVAHDVPEHPALACLHAGLMDAVAEHVIGVAHDDTAQLVTVLYD